MKLAVQITSWIAIAIGALATIGGFGMTDAGVVGLVDPYALLGGLMYLGLGLLSFIYTLVKE